MLWPDVGETLLLAAYVTLALFWMMAGLGAVMVPIWKAWAAKALDEKSLLLQEAQRNEVQWLIPGLLATLFTGVALGS